jgi:hypothetical protein
MNKMVRALITLAIFFLICPASGQADIVYIKNGDKLCGKIKNPSFTLKSAYGKIQIEREFLKSLSFENHLKTTPSAAGWSSQSTTIVLAALCSMTVFKSFKKTGNKKQSGEKK